MRGRSLARRGLPAILLVSILAGCAGGGGSQQGGGRYAMDQDAYPDSPEDVANVPDAVPKVEPRSRSGNRSTYSVWGKTYHVLDDPTGYSAEGRASWYGVKFQGYDTANGETYDMYKMSAAHRSLPLPTYARVTNLDNGRKVIVRVNDRGPFHSDRLIDLSYAAAARLGILKGGTGRVKVEAIDPVAWARTHGRSSSTGDGTEQTELASRPASAAPAPVSTRAAPNRSADPRSYAGKTTDYEATIDPLLAAANDGAPAGGASARPARATSSSGGASGALSARSGSAASPSAGASSLSAGQRYVQVAALGSLAGAEALKSRLQGLLSRPVRIDNASPLYRVQVGPIEDLASLDSIRATLRDAGYGQVFLVAPTQ
ncbi:septal ring lytic transglycosylase RlpA family protein [Salinicola acroporae]|uniref:Endolytic peptidoglycan transglycosylase RlpA n=1 Tax=Salinicola acroporae TaxID=1541440 RepID=A0ABT6I5R3_9GAMM|nr:septal ring lytic transglycosylase RlpA family protein [Salinicola acroporae]MDH4572986.1 septal ring lytic transglycosylase RlpA [Salinicola acroporae]